MTGDGKQKEARTFDDWYKEEGARIVRTTNATTYEYMREAWNAARQASQPSHASGELEQAYRESAAAYAEIGPGRTLPIGATDEKWADPYGKDFVRFSENQIEAAKREAAQAMAEKAAQLCDNYGREGDRLAKE